MNIIYIVLGLIFLVFGGDWLLKGAINLSIKLNISKIVIGMTVVSFATSAPELIVSIKSALNGFPDLSLGNVIGSNIANLALVLGITVCLGKIDVGSSFYKIDWPVMMLASILLYVFIGFDMVLERYEGIIMFSALILFLVYILRFQKNIFQRQKIKSSLQFSKKLELMKNYLPPCSDSVFTVKIWMKIWLIFKIDLRRLIRN